MDLKSSINSENRTYIPAAFYLKPFTKEFKMNFHVHDYFEIMYAVSNSFKILYNRQDEVKEKLITEGQFVFIDADVPHCLVINNDCKICNFEISTIENIEYKEFNINLMLKKVPNFIIFLRDLKSTAVMNDTENVLGTIKKIHTSIERDIKDCESSYHLLSLIFNLFIDFGRCYQTTLTSENSIYIVKCLNYINNNLSDKLSPKRISSILNISESYLHRLFKLHLGTTINSYINSKRIELSKNLLINTTESVSKISESVGFGTRQSFNKTFLEKESMTPLAFRKTYKTKTYNKLLLDDYEQTQILKNNE